MAESIGWATLQVIPSLRGFDSNVNRQLSGQTARAGREAGDQYGKGFHNGYAGWVQRIAALTAAVGIGKVLSSVVSEGVKGAANLETLTTSFTSLLGSAKAANAEIVSLQGFAAKTPFSQQDVFGYAQQYLSLANSIGLAKDQVQPFLTTIGDIAAVTGASNASIHNAVLAIGQIGSAGKVTLDNLNQISEAFPGFNGAAAIASATGQTTAQVMKEIGSGAIDAQTGVQALLQGMRDFPGAAGAMEKQSKTLAGVWSTFKDTIQISLTQAFAPLVPTIKTVLSELTPAISQALSTFAPAITTFAQQIVPLLQPLLAGFSTAFTAVFQALGPALAAIAPVIQPLAGAFAQLAQAVAPLLTFGAQILATVGPPLLALFQNLLIAVQPLVAVFVSSFQPVLPVIAQAFAQIGAALAPVVAALAQTLAPVLPILAQVFTQLVQAIAPLAGTIGQALVTVIQALGPQLPQLARSFGSMAVSLAQILAALGPVIQLFGKLVALGLAPLLKAMAAGAAAISDALGGVADGISTVVSGLHVLGGGAVESSVGLDISTGSALGLAAALHGVIDAMDQLSQRNLASDKQQAAAARNRAGEAKKAKQTAAGTTVPKFTVPDVKAALPAFDSSTLASFLNQATGRQANPLTAALNSIFTSAKAAGKTLSSALVAQLRGENRDLIGLTKDRDRIAQRLQAAKQKLSDLISQRTQEASTIKSAVTSTFDVGNLPKPDFGEPITLAGIMRRLATAVSNARRFNSILRRLAKEGLPSALLQQLAEAGPDALPAARALLTATPKQLRTIKSEFRQLGQTGASIGKLVSHDMFDAGIQSARGLAKGLETQQSTLNKAIRKLAKSMVAELRATLGINSPSRVMHQLGVFSGHGFALGLDSTTGRVRSSADRLANGALPRSQSAAWAAGGSRGGDVTVIQNITNPIPERASASGAAGIRRAAQALGR